MVDQGTERARLQRIAFGKAETQEEQAAALSAQQQLAELDGPAPAKIDQDPTGEAEELSRPPDARPESVEEEAVTSRRSVAWFGAAVLAGIAVGAVGSAAVILPEEATEPSPTSTRTSSPTSPIPEGANAVPSDPVAAENWLNTAPTPEDEFPEAFVTPVDELPEIYRSTHHDPRTSRLVDRMDDAHALWVMRTLDGGGFCLVETNLEKSTSSGSCLSKDHFATRGLTLNYSGGYAQWNGQMMDVTRRVHP